MTLPLPGFEPMESESTPCAEASPAKTSASRARVPAWTVSAPGSGESTAGSLASYDPVSCSWRTSGLFEAEDSPLYSETLPRSGMTRSGTLYLLPPLVRLTSVIASGSSLSIPTPTARLGDSTGRTIPSAETAARRWSEGRRNLDDWAALLPTPSATSLNDCASPQAIVDRREREKAKGRNGNGFGLNLGQWATLKSAELLPTPTSSSSGMADQRGKPSPGAKPGVSLSDWAMGFGGPLLPTPQAQDSRNCADYSDGSRGHSPQLRHLGRGRLNPRFVEWMMGLPPGWTDADGLDKTEPG